MQPFQTMTTLPSLDIKSKCDRLFYLICVEEQEASVKCHGLLLRFSQFVLKSICSCCFNFLL